MAPNGEQMGVSFPKRQILYKILIGFGTHSYYNTLVEALMKSMIAALRRGVQVGITALIVLSLANAADPQKPKSKKDDINQIGNRNIGKCLNFYSLDKEIALGKQLAEEVQRQAKMYDDSMLGEYVNRIGQNLA